MARILVIDDDSSIRFLVQEELALAGHIVGGAPDGASGLAAVEENRPDLVILDVKMPGMSGLEVLRRLKAAQPGLPVFLFTAYGDFRNEAERLGADAYFVKSPNFTPILEAIRQKLNRVH